MKINIADFPIFVQDGWLVARDHNHLEWIDVFRELGYQSTLVTDHPHIFEMDDAEFTHFALRFS